MLTEAHQIFSFFFPSFQAACSGFSVTSVPADLFHIGSEQMVHVGNQHRSPRGTNTCYFGAAALWSSCRGCVKATENRGCARAQNLRGCLKAPRTPLRRVGGESVWGGKESNQLSSTHGHESLMLWWQSTTGRRVWALLIIHRAHEQGRNWRNGRFTPEACLKGSASAATGENTNLALIHPEFNG